MSMSWQSWLGANPYLVPLARFHGAVEATLARLPERTASVGSWEGWRADAAAGVPILLSSAAGIDFAPAAAASFTDLALGLDDADLPARVAAPLGELRRRLAGERGAADAVIAWSSSGGGVDGAPENAGLVRLLSWAALRRVLSAVTREAGARDEAEWGRSRCPTCGALPAMAQLVESQGGRARLLACACCATRWRYRRIGCPFCDAGSPEQLAILEVEGAVPLRLDVCDGCKGYLKTYTDVGDEELFLADWSTLHLDVAAARHGLRRLGASLYDLTDDGSRS